MSTTTHLHLQTPTSYTAISLCLLTPNHFHGGLLTTHSEFSRSICALLPWSFWRPLVQSLLPQT